MQWAVARVLGLPHNRVNVTCRRLGGGFGGKSMRSCPPAAAVALAAFKLRRQVGATPASFWFIDQTGVLHMHYML